MNPKQKTAIIVVALVLVPIILVCCAFALALGCAEFWSSGRFTLIKPWIRRQLATARKQLKPPRAVHTSRCVITETDSHTLNQRLTLVSNINLKRNNRVLRLTPLTLDGFMDAFYCFTTQYDHGQTIGSSWTKPVTLMTLTRTELAPTVAMHSFKTPLQLDYKGLTKSCM
ncbi:hypothetical protein BDW72DRAFT_208486 [Aspergillus terricola var. indicus]